MKLWELIALHNKKIYSLTRDTFYHNRDNTVKPGEAPQYFRQKKI